MQQLDFLPTLPSLLAHPKTPLIHRDLSWLQFNERVLAEARQAANPLLERAKFLAISAANIDEFFTIRVASLGRSIQSASKVDSQAGARLGRIRDSILETVAKFTAKQSEALDILDAELDSEGIHLPRNPRPQDPAFAVGKKLFEEHILPKLTPAEPFAIAQLQLLENLQIGALFPKANTWLRIPKGLPQMLWAPIEGTATPEYYFFFVDGLLQSHLGGAFNLLEKPGFLRLTRDGDFTLDLEEEDPESIPDVVRTGIRSRDKGRVVRLQYSGEISHAVLGQAAASLKLESGQIFPAPQTLCMSGLWTLVQQAPERDGDGKTPLRYPALPTTIPVRLRDRARIFDEIKAKDVLLHHPYDSFDSFVNWVQTACDDPAVTSIEQTVYRMDAVSPVIDALKLAASRGKRVRVIIELRARFDELNNLTLAEELRKAGVEVAFGFGKLKLHAKIALITRKEPDGPEGLRLYTHLSTGNYNASTARLYTDLAILTANPMIGQDARTFFDSVFDGQVPVTFKQLVSAPARLHRRLINLIQAETDAAKQGKPARIVAKVNALVDAVVIDHLYRASQAGVQIDLIVRGACSLIPGIQGLSDNIRVVSIVDRFLEHSRIYYFSSSKALYLSSADWMPRNFFSRLELAFPVLDESLFAFIEGVIIPTYLTDTMKARELTPQGTWKKHTKTSIRPELRPSKPVRSQFLFADLAQKEYAGSGI